MKAKELIKVAQEKVESYNTNELMNIGFIPQDGGYFPAIYYPPITMYPKSNEEEMFHNFAYDNTRPLSIYLHIPFCPRRCLYCHWVVSVGNSTDEMDEYIKYLDKEMVMYGERLGTNAISPKSILIGGGTPSMLPPAQTEKLLNSLRNRFNLNDCRQITCEIEPTTILGDVGREKLKIMKDLGVNRISLGVQSFDDDMLKMMGRMHTSADTIAAIKQIKNAGFESLSIDLIYGYPGCTIEKWAETLKTSFSLDIDACQQYRLRIVPHGAKRGVVKNHFDKSPEVFPSLKQIQIMKEFGILYASQSGLNETSRRVFAKGNEHNSVYLTEHTDELADVLGMGISSWCNIQGHLMLNTGKSLERYYSYLDKGKIPIARGKVRTHDDEKRWAIALTLKHHGISKIKYKKITGEEIDSGFGAKIRRLKNFGLLVEDEKMITLSEKGRFFADEVVIQFYHHDFMPFPQSAYATGELNPYNS